MKTSIKRIFLSSTGDDLQQYREVIIESIALVDGAECICMEHFGPDNTDPLALFERKVLSCDIFIGLVGFHFGGSPDGSKKSYTQLEFDWSHDLERLIWLAPETVPLPVPKQAGKLHDLQNEFRESLIRGNNTIDRSEKSWAGPFQLANSVLIALFRRLNSSGYTIEQHKALLRLQERKVRAQLAEVNSKIRSNIQKLETERVALQNQLKLISNKLSNLSDDFKNTQLELEKTKIQLSKYEGYFDHKDMREAFSALENGDISKAQFLFIRVARYCEDQAKVPLEGAGIARLELGKLDVKRGNFTAAISNLSNAHENLPNSLDAKIYLAFSLFKSGQLGAFELLDKAELLAFKKQKDALLVYKIKYMKCMTSRNNHELVSLTRVYRKECEARFGISHEITQKFLNAMANGLVEKPPSEEWYFDLD